MLERASTCLESGGRQLLRCSKRGARSRRMLHSSFWHHGAADLSLPSWWASTSAFARPAGSDDSGANRADGSDVQGYDGALLDFLYPEKTLALMQKISSYGADNLKARRRQSSRASGIRQFSTTHWQGQRMHVRSDILDPEEEERERKLKSEMDQWLYLSSPREALETLLLSDEKEKYELAMRLYAAIPEGTAPSKAQVQLLEYVESAPVKDLASRIISVFEALPEAARLASSYRIATSAYLAIGMVGSAVQLYETAATRRLDGDLGVNILLERTVRDNQWELCLRVYRAFVRTRTPEEVRTYAFYQKTDRLKSTSALAWDKVGKIPYLRGNLESFLLHVKQFREELTSTQASEKWNETFRTVQHFTFGLATETMEQVFSKRPIDEQVISEFFTSFFEAIRALNIPSRGLYEYAITRLLNIRRYRLYSSTQDIFLILYEMYCEDCRNGRLAARPSKEVLRKLIVQYGKLRSESHVERIVTDLRSFYPDEAIPHHTLKYLCQFYADVGQANKFHEYFNDYARTYESQLGLNTLMLLPFVYARRADVLGADKQFRRISDEFGRKPDTGCWNALLLAYTRADDLDGALACFNNILDSGCAPDLYTFGPMLELCAARGDVEAFEALYSRAEQLEVPVRTNRWARSGYVQACLNADDIEGAEATARAMLRSYKGGLLDGNLTHVWNMLIQHHALQRDVGRCRELYKEMIDNKIPLDSWTYGSLMRSLIEVDQTNAAYKILRVTMPNNNLQVHALHYAIVMTGFLREKQYSLALRAHKRMLARGIPQTASSRLASLEVTGVIEMLTLRQNNNRSPLLRLKEVEELLRDTMLGDFESEVADREPRHREAIDTRHSVPEGYFGLLILLYGTRRSFDIIKELFEAVAIAREDEVDYTPPVTLLTALMDTHFRAKQYDEVEKCWELAKTQAERLVKTLDQVANPSPPQPEFDSIIDPTIRQRFEDARIASNRRQVLTKPTMIYIRSLAAQLKAPDALLKAQRAVRSLLSSGFVLDNRTWNEFIQMQAQRGATIDAFTTCETYLMPNFPGWRDMNPYYVRKDRPGFQWMEVRHTDVTPGAIMPRYQTLVILARVYAEIRREETNGLGYNTELGGWEREILERMCPLTVRAIQTMPRTGDQWQRRFLGDILYGDA